MRRFAMRLAKEMGIPNVNGMLRGISGNDLVEWMAYAKLEPFGEERDDLRMAILGTFLGNVLYQLHTGKEDTPFTIEMLMPKFEESVEPISKEDAIAAIDMAFTAMAMATAASPTLP